MMQKTAHKMNVRSGQAGFTLMELLIVMIILGILAALVGPKFFGRIGSSKLKAAKAQISLLETALDAYRLDIGKYPTTDQGLQALRQNPDGNKAWQGPYLPKAVPQDPWDAPYQYTSPSEHGDFEIVSLGADKTEGGEGENMDVFNWKNLKQE